MAADEPQRPISTQDRPHAPIVYFEGAATCSHMNGLGRITLSAALQLPESDGISVRTELVATAYLRSNIQGMIELRNQINTLLLLLQPPETAAKN